MPSDNLKNMVQFLKETDRYSALISRYEENIEDRSFWFEIAFAFWFETDGYHLKYEVNANPENDSSVDFELVEGESKYFFELLRVENSDQVSTYIENQKNQDSKFIAYELLLTSDHKNPFFNTAAQIIRLQEKLLEKVRKFHVPEENKYSIIVCDCSNIHGGMLDAEDVRITMFGRPNNPHFQEYWEGSRLKGMYEEKYSFRNSKEFKNRVSAVIFVPKLGPDSLKKSMLVVNQKSDKSWQENLESKLKGIKPFS